jgi:hypothetical protein
MAPALQSTQVQTTVPRRVFLARQIWRSMMFLVVLIGLSSASAYWDRPWPAEPFRASEEAHTEPVAAFVPFPIAQVAAERENVRDLFDEAVDPLVTIALRAREDRQRKDPTYDSRIDSELNRGRINFLLFGYGETFEPPLPRDIIGTITVLSLDYRVRKIAQISLTHDARAPEIERVVRDRGLAPHPSKIDTTYRHGGFDLMRLAVENATGLSIDYQIATEDVLVRQLVDDVLGGIEIDNPIALATNPIYLQGVEHPCGRFPRGRQLLDGIRTMCYLKGLVMPPYDPAKENNVRKPIVFQALKESVERNLTNPLFSLRMLALFQQQLEHKTVAYDFDARSLVIGTLSHLAGGALSQRFTIPSIDQNVYLVDERAGDGGLSWVMGSQNPIIKDELRRGIYKDTAMEVAGGDPYAIDLAKGYWGSVRTIVKSKLMRTDRLLLKLPTRPPPNGRQLAMRPF